MSVCDRIRVGTECLPACTHACMHACGERLQPKSERERKRGRGLASYARGGGDEGRERAATTVAATSAAAAAARETFPPSRSLALACRMSERQGKGSEGSRSPPPHHQVSLRDSFPWCVTTRSSGVGIMVAGAAAADWQSWPAGQSRESRLQWQQQVADPSGS